MTQSELFAALETLGLPVAYRLFKAATSPPYLVYFLVKNDDIGADNRNYVKVERYQAELYTAEKDPELEEQLEGILKANKLVYTKTEAYIDTEKLNQVVYSFQLI